MPNFLKNPIYRTEKTKNSKKQVFLFGIINTNKEWTTQEVKKTIKFFNIEIYGFKQDVDTLTKFVCGHQISKTDMAEVFCKQYKSIIKEHDIVICLCTHIGETTIFLHLIDAYFKKLGAKNPLIIGLKPYHKDLVKMLHPNIPIHIIQNLKFSLSKPEYQTSKHKIKVIFPKSYFDMVEDSLRNKNAPIRHFIKHILNYLNLKEKDFSKTKILISEAEKQEVIEKTKNIGLNVDNFVFFSPEAYTCADLGFERWLALKAEYEAKGYDIFCNICSSKKDYKIFKQCDLTLKQAYILASMSKEIIGLRSGLLDLLLLTKVPMRVFYSEANERESYKPLSKEEIEMGFDMKNMPNYLL